MNKKIKPFLKKKIPPLKITSQSSELEKLKFQINSAKSNEELSDLFLRIADLYMGKKEFFLAEDYFEKFLAINPNHIEGNIGYTHILYANNKKKHSLDLAEKLYQKNPHNIPILSLSAYINTLENNHSRAIELSKAIIDIEPDYVFAYHTIQSNSIVLKRFQETIKYSRKFLDKNPNDLESLKNLAVTYTYLGNYKESIKILRKIEALDPINHIVGSLLPFISTQTGKKEQTNYIDQPLDFISEFHIDLENQENLKFKDDIISYLKKCEKDWSPKNKSTNKGYQTTSFELSHDTYPLNKLKLLFQKKINEYIQKYSSSNTLFIKHLNEKRQFSCWGVFLKNNGFQESHNHSSGWLSAVFYLDIPDKLKGDEGNIEFSLHGYEFPKNSNIIPKKKIEPKDGKLILFPSTLYHKTIPFKSKKERISMAFDLY
tara:strand:+ start:153 stop:1442 length:1290 start_codon:yes stop_codon:yes gene_type:complete